MRFNSGKLHTAGFLNAAAPAVRQGPHWRGHCESSAGDAGAEDGGMFRHARPHHLEIDPINPVARRVAEGRRGSQVINAGR